LIYPGDYYCFYAHDHLYSPVTLTFETSVIERYEYDAYGKPTFYSASWGTYDAFQTISNIGFTGRELDMLDNGSLKIMYYRARYYDPETGRFMQRDPLGYVDSANFYEYVTSRPNISTDPFGEKFLRWGPWVTLLDESSTKTVAENIPLLPPVPYFIYVKSDSICCRKPYNSYVLETHLLMATFDIELIGGLNVQGRAYTNLISTVWQIKVHATVDIRLPIEQNDTVVATGSPQCVHETVAAVVNSLAEKEKGAFNKMVDFQRDNLQKTLEVIPKPSLGG